MLKCVRLFIYVCRGLPFVHVHCSQIIESPNIIKERHKTQASNGRAKMQCELQEVNALIMKANLSLSLSFALGFFLFFYLSAQRSPTPFPSESSGACVSERVSVCRQIVKQLFLCNRLWVFLPFISCCKNSIYELLHLIYQIVCACACALLPLSGTFVAYNITPDKSSCLGILSSQYA